MTLCFARTRNRRDRNPAGDQAGGSISLGHDAAYSSEPKSAFGSAWPRAAAMGAFMMIFLGAGAISGTASRYPTKD